MGIYITGLKEDDSPKAIALQTGIDLESICEDYEYNVFISTYPRRQVSVTAYEDTDLDDIDGLDESDLLRDVVDLLSSVQGLIYKMDEALYEQELAREEAEGREFNCRTSSIDLSDYDMEDVKMRDDDDYWTIGLTD